MATLTRSTATQLHYTDPKSGIEITISKYRKTDGFNENFWAYSLPGAGFEDPYRSKNACWAAMRVLVKEAHEQIKGLSSSEIFEKAKAPYVPDITKAIMRSMAKKLQARGR